MRLSPWDLPLLFDANKYSNFRSFVESVTPTIPSMKLPKVRAPILNGVPQPLCQEIVDSFSLSSLWEFYDDQSFYGNGVPILLNNGESVVQYYCPSLSALQIYTDKPSSPPRMLGKSYAAKHDSSSWSDESENDELSMSLSNNSSKSSDFASDDSFTEQDASCQAVEPFGELYCQYNETLNPYQRVPMREKINQLAREYPGLLKFHSTDLSPYSWIAIAWYPIYQIPLIKNVKELSACFVTYHSLSSSFKDAANASREQHIGDGVRSLKEEKSYAERDDAANASPKEGIGNSVGRPEEGKGAAKRGEKSVPPFAVATYKMSSDLWANPKMFDEKKIESSLSSATSWLKLLNFQHHDFSFFMSHRSF